MIDSNNKMRYLSEHKLLTLKSILNWCMEPHKYKLSSFLDLQEKLKDTLIDN